MQDDYKNRQIIPRWYPFEYAFRMGEIGSVQKPPVAVRSPKLYKLKEDLWLQDKELPLAIDFLGSAFLSNDYENPIAIEASKFILKNYEKVSGLAKEVAEKFIHVPEAEPSFDLSEEHGHRLKISMLKKHVRQYPLNSIAWADMAFYYAIIAQNEKAEQCMLIALNIAPENRFILRSAARFFIHIDDPERALFCLRRAGLTRYDPWLLASEISIAEAFNFRTSNIKIAKNILSTGNASPRDLTELLGTMGTLEAKSGENKKAKKLFRSALIDTNENTLAQAEWISPKIGFSVELPPNVLAAFEADMRRFYRDGRFKEALDSALKWLRFQPFSSKAAVQASYIAGVCLNDHQKALEIIEKVTTGVSEHDFILKNNRIFSLASLDRVDEAKQLFSKFDYNLLSEAERATYHATEGLLKFRSGEIEGGRLLYEKATQIFRKLQAEIGETLAMFFWVREEKRVNNDVKEMSNKVINLAKRLGLKELL